MKLGFYPKLAIDGMRKNRRMYLPYLLTCVGMVMMTYIINFIRFADTISAMNGGDTVQTFMVIGTVIITFFAAIFLFYTNSFLIKRRKREFGLYNILGMDKGNISRLLLWESLFIAAAALIFGLALGIVLSKLVELGLANLLNSDTVYFMSVPTSAVVFTILPNLAIFALLFLNSLWQLRSSTAIALLRSDNYGEKPPKANWLLGILGIVLLGVAYYLAVNIEDPITAIGVFMVAVLLVIAATYIIMISGSVLLCRILQRRKSYYYKPNHFVSVASMAYRMKRNGAGLASICILATMVLVMLSSTTTLFIGAEDVIKNRYPREMVLRFYNAGALTSEDEEKVEAVIADVLREYDTEAVDLVKYHTSSVAGALYDDTLIYDTDAVKDMTLGVFSNLHQVYVVPLADYNYMMGTSVTLEDDEVLAYSPRKTWSGAAFRFDGERQYRVKELLTDSFMNADMSMDIVPPLMLIVNDAEEMTKNLVKVTTDADGGERTYDFVSRKWNYYFDTTLSGEANVALHKALSAALSDFTKAGGLEGSFVRYGIENRTADREGFYALYGGLLYLGIILSIIFMSAAVLIIYYKQVSEGYEDQSRFEIMQKVGMTKKDISRSINSQLLTVFFLPLATAGLHLTFAFPIIEKLLLLFNLRNHTLFLSTTAASYLIFALLYAIVYRITSRAYYKIVS